MRLALNHSAMRWVLVFSTCAVAITAAAHAEWPKQFSEAYTGQCVLSCEKNPKHTPASRAKCKAYCECSTHEAEQRFPDYVAVAKAAFDPNSDVLKRLKAEVFPICRRVFRPS